MSVVLFFLDFILAVAIGDSPAMIAGGNGFGELTSLGRLIEFRLHGAPGHCQQERGQGDRRGKGEISNREDRTRRGPDPIDNVVSILLGSRLGQTQEMCGMWAQGL